MKNDIVFTNKMNQLGIFIIPIRFPVFIIIDSPLFCSADITDGCIKPYIQHFSFRIFQRHFYTPIQVSCNGA